MNPIMGPAPPRPPRILALLLLLALSACRGLPPSPGPSPAASSHTPAATAPRPSPLLFEEVTWKLRWDLSYHNSQDRPTSVQVEFPIPRDRGSWQSVQEVTFQPQPHGQKTDAFGNRLALYRWRDVPPGSTVHAQVGARVSRRAVAFAPDASRIRPPGPELSEFLKSEPGILAGDPVIQRAARDVVGQETNPYYRLVMLYDFVRDLDFQLTRQAKSDLEALRSRVVQCSDAAGLLVSMARSLGLPARYVAGVYLRPEEPGTRTSHAWAEVWIEPHGWLPVDPTMGRFPESRGSRLGQLDSAYVVAWEGRGSQGIVANGAADGDVQLTLSHEIAGQHTPSAPVLTPPSLLGNRDLSAMLPRGQALRLLQQGMAEPDGPRRLQILRRAQGLDPGSVALMRAVVTSTPPGEAWTRLDQDLAARFSSPVVRFGRGLVALQEGRWSEAERQLQAAGTDFAVQHALTELYLRTCQPTRAARALEAATRQAVTFHLADCAVTLMADLGDHAGLALVAEQASRVFPGEPEFLLARGQALFRLGLEDRAVEVLREYGRARPGEGLADAVLGMLYLERGQPDRAAPLLRRGLAGRLEEPDRAWFSQILQRLGPGTPPIQAPGPPRRPAPDADS